MNDNENYSVNSSVFSCAFQSWERSVSSLLEQSKVEKKVGDGRRVLIKPNIVEALAPPITTPVELIEAIVDYLLNFIAAENIIIGEGCGATEYDTLHAFAKMGYTELATSRGVELIDLNKAESQARTKPECRRWPQMYLPKILDEVFLFSVPQLKAHSLAGVTLTMKNMMGCAPPRHYKGGGAWNKASFHTNIQAAIFDLNRYRCPDFTLLDATIGMAQAHLWGPKCSPPVNTLAASFDPVAIDSYGASLLGRRWQDIDHIAMADGVLGRAEQYQLEVVG